MNEYQTALDIVIDRLGEINDDEELVYAVDTLQQLLYLYRHRIIDAQVLNDLRVMTNTMGDLDLKHEVRRLVNWEIAFNKLGTDYTKKMIDIYIRKGKDETTNL